MRSFRSRLAVVAAATGLVAASSGLVMLATPAAQAAQGDKVGVCHRDRTTSTYEYVEVSSNATGEPNGHRQHLADGNAADPDFPDYILTSGGLPAGVDTEAEFELWCGSLNTPDPVTGTIGSLGITPVAGCGTYGSIDVPTSTNVQYSVEGGSWTGLSGEYDVVATLTNGATEFTTPLPDDWSLGTAAGTAIRTVDVGDFVACADPDPDPEPVLLVTPEDPDVTQPRCTDPGLLEPLVVDWTDGLPAGVSYSYDEASRVFTATAGAGYELEATLTTGWTRVSDTSATFVVNVTAAGDCLVTVSAEEPTASPATCDAAGHLVLPSADDDGYSWRGDTTDQPGDHDLEAVADTGYVLTGDTTWSVHVPAAAEGLSGCGGGTPDDDDTPGDGIPGGGGDTPGGGGGTVTPTNVVPLEPNWVEATCSTSAKVEYRTVTGVAYRTVGDVAPGNRVVVESEALTGYSFADGTVSWWAHTFDTPRRCGGGGDDTDGGGTGGGDDSGEEPNGPAEPAPTVKGVQKFRPHAGKGDNADPGTGGPHAVPTAVAAGLSDLSDGHGSPSTFSSPQLAQALVAGGLLLLVVGGGLGLGRRTNGAHEF